MGAQQGGGGGKNYPRSTKKRPGKGTKAEMFLTNESKTHPHVKILRDISV